MRISKEDSERLAKYWKKTARRDFRTMQHLFETRRYSDSLFFGHIVLEKILKGIYVTQHNKHAPYSHDLIFLYKNIKDRNLTDDEVKLLDEVNDFNINARYPGITLEFYKLATKSYTRNYINLITNLYKKLCRNI